MRTTRAHLRPTPPARADLLLPTGDADLLVAVEATHASFAAAVVAPLVHLPAARTALLVPRGWQPPSAYIDHHRSTVHLGARVDIEPSVVLAAGHYTEIGEAAHALAEERGVPFFVSQHGALTPYAPPLPRAAHLLAWSEADAEFWTTGRQDVDVSVTGSQLLWGVSRLARTGAGSGGPLTYLGQGHAAEIPRARLAHAALTTCREHDAVYRPHPSERDVTSRAVLAAYERAGITVDRSDRPLVDLDTPIVSVFSTGVLEAAAQGRDAWVDFPRPPAWLGEFWERYAMHRLGSDPTPAPARPAVEPAQRVADIVRAAAS
ncbi:RNA-binding protein [Microbacterium sp. ARD31]|uniref:RNA-binding protein n=1 Tax=Microbacterium sp. ARD31 TaxID=2962576 RepID=UPI0028811114|nr:RNA-binding protein [Microbacterium sp. ARD31]MDT0183418.1 RNA-binding protein [Microbacterium sp. ARD31]